MPTASQEKSSPNATASVVPQSDERIAKDALPRKLPAAESPKPLPIDSATLHQATSASVNSQSNNQLPNELNSQPSKSSVSIFGPALADANQSDVFYATDRRMIQTASFAFWIPVLLPLIIVVIGTIIAAVAYLRSNIKWLWAIASAACLVACVLVSMKAYSKSVQAQQLAKVGGVFFGGKRNEVISGSVMSYGCARITLPPNHKAGMLERPNLLRLEFSESTDRHVVIRQVATLEASNFFSSIDQSLETADDESILMFIHGYNVGFEDALRRTAQLAIDLRYQGIPMLYSWPSVGRLTGYATDESTVDWSVLHLEQLILDLKQRTHAKKIHVIVHSMGNRILLGAVERLTLRFPTAQPMLGQVVMAAPDVDLSQFESRYRPAIQQACDRVTLYTSTGDRALLASMAVHGYNRLGLSRKDLRTYAGIDTIDVSGLDTSLLGHSYYGSQSDLVKDIHALIELGDPPPRRRWLQQVAGSADPGMWRFTGEVEIAKSKANSEAIR